ncbi:metalloproteinase inhibitor 1-like [Anolis sagrei]|uniref:metalloproteinase inhibitor 1-like n=1 Tax=Anolis sagrei TaxID=38937 RepID=UPI003522A423
MWPLDHQITSLHPTSLQVYKGPEEVQDVHYVDTQTIPGLCEYHYQVDHTDEYIIAGELDGDTVWLSVCAFLKRWSRVTPEQRRGFTSEYSKGCSCSIVWGRLGGSISSNQCVWSDKHLPTDFQYERMACLPQVEKSGMCTWKSLGTQEPGSFRNRRLTQ